MTAEQILDRYIQATGGAAAAAGLTSYTAKGICGVLIPISSRGRWRCTPRPLTCVPLLLTHEFHVVLAQSGLMKWMEIPYSFLALTKESEYSDESRLEVRPGTRSTCSSTRS